MDNIIATTRLYKNYQLAIPKAIRNQFKDLSADDTIVDWSINENNEIIIKPRKKVCLDDVLGIIEDDDLRDAVELKRSLY
ncbi:hypothetical protein [Methanobrevibacter olleyae]|uniref:SpoVT-AbrB domain-containing protein n=1 Tax=Methanobrevibacter olleyae TaxID=294671 RepID=A0A126QYV6_METOL|nr:hypothetical protein [Methanobrevibacter olleyae]AMK15221.1 hypothetical protein YLM1_0664 [Methanobrevibacter olleyae]SFL71440.1 hypothetical protein SAMN02910297_01583 [Methanobrevibacter olleyae]